MYRKIIYILTVVSLTAVLSGCFGTYKDVPTDNSAPEDVSTPEEVVVPEDVTAPEDVAAPEDVVTEAREITVIGSDFKFDPSSIELSAGEKVKIVFKNDGSAPHDLQIEELGLATKVIGSGETTTLEFTAPTTGTYTTYCSVAGHREAGMEGSIVIK